MSETTVETTAETEELTTETGESSSTEETGSGVQWINLNDVYVSTNGGAISGDLSVNGTLAINNGSGSTYDVASEISTLRDSISRAVMLRKGGSLHTCYFNKVPGGNFDLVFRTDDEDYAFYFSNTGIGLWNNATKATVWNISAV